MQFWLQNGTALNNWMLSCVTSFYGGIFLPRVVSGGRAWSMLLVPERQEFDQRLLVPQPDGKG
jgi:hypothetical protein